LAKIYEDMRAQKAKSADLHALSNNTLTVQCEELEALKLECKQITLRLDSKFRARGDDDQRLEYYMFQEEFRNVTDLIARLKEEILAHDEAFGVIRENIQNERDERAQKQQEFSGSILQKLEGVIAQITEQGQAPKGEKLGAGSTGLSRIRDEIKILASSVEEIKQDIKTEGQRRGAQNQLLPGSFQHCPGPTTSGSGTLTRASTEERTLVEVEVETVPQASPPKASDFPRLGNPRGTDAWRTPEGAAGAGPKEKTVTSPSRQQPETDEAVHSPCRAARNEAMTTPRSSPNPGRPHEVMDAIQALRGEVASLQMAQQLMPPQVAGAAQRRATLSPSRRQGGAVFAASQTANVLPSPRVSGAVGVPGVSHSSPRPPSSWMSPESANAVHAGASNLGLPMNRPGCQAR
jgi:hypothetical protein